MKRRNRDRFDRRLRRSAQQSRAIGGVFRLPDPAAEERGDERIAAARRIDQREQPRVAGGDVAEFAPDHERQFVGAEELQVLTRDNQRVRFAESDRVDRHEVVVADEDLRRRDAEPARERVRRVRRDRGNSSCRARMLLPSNRPRESETNTMPATNSSATCVGVI